MPITGCGKRINTQVLCIYEQSPDPLYNISSPLLSSSSSHHHPCSLVTLRHISYMLVQLPLPVAVPSCVSHDWQYSNLLTFPSKQVLPDHQWSRWLPRPTV